MKTFKMTAGTYYITDCCMTHDDYYDNFLLKEGGDNWDVWGTKMGSSFIRATGADGAGVVRDMNNNIVGSWGSDAANVSVVPAKLCDDVPEHCGTKVTFDDDFIIKVYHDSIIVGDRYRVRMYVGL